ncbi:MAG: DUF805 domain-containing protein [Pseudomonadota bacterium]
MQHYIGVLKRYFDFNGRSARPEFWWFVLINIIISIVLAFIDSALGTVFIGLIYSLAVLLPALGVTVRRLHDTDMSGWWVLISLIPLVGAIALIVFCARAGTAGDNRFGPPVAS